MYISLKSWEMEIKIGAFPVLISIENQKCAPIAGEF